MRNIETYINNQLADFTDLESLPLSWSKSTDKFMEIVGASGIELEQAFRSMSFPSSQNNCRIFQASQNQSTVQRGDTVFQMKINADGIQVFNGSVALKNTIRKHGKIHSFVVEAIGDGMTLWEKLDSVTLSQLDLGEQMWTGNAIRATWTQTVDDNNCIFAPVVYGSVFPKLSVGAFAASDFRLSVYFIAIIKAIFKKVGYTIESGFFASQLMRESVYLYGNGSKMVRSGDYANFGASVKAANPVEYGIGFDFFQVQFDTEISDPLSQFAANDFTTQNKGEYEISLKIQTNAECTVEFRVVNGSTTRTTSYSTNGSNKVLIKHKELLLVGEVVKIYIYNNDWQNQIVQNFTFWIDVAELLIVCSSKPIIGTTINIASCLHDKPVKDFLRGITHLFCGAWHVNETIKTVYFEPRFDYVEEIDSVKTTYNGFYNNVSFTPVEIVTDIQSVETDFMLPFGEKLTLAYAEDSSDPLEAEYKKGDTLPPYSTFIQFNKRGGKENTSRNPYFSTLYQSSPNAIRRYGESLPTVLPSGYDIGELLSGTIVTSGTPPTTQTVGEITYESSPKCGLIIRDGVYINFEDENEVVYANFAAPFLTQQFARANDPQYNFCLSYSDVLRPADNQTTRGLSSNFFQKYFAIIRQGIQAKLYGQIRLTDLATTSFRRLVAVDFDNNPSLWILLSINDFKISTDTKANLYMMKHAEPTQGDADKMTFFDPQIDIITPDITKAI